MTEHEAFLTQYVLNRCLGKDGTLEGYFVADSAEKAWQRIQEFSRADDQPEPFLAKEWQDRLNAACSGESASPVIGGLENENDNLKKHSAFLECKCATLMNEKAAILLRYDELKQQAASLAEGCSEKDNEIRNLRLATGFAYNKETGMIHHISAEPNPALENVLAKLRSYVQYCNRREKQDVPILSVDDNGATSQLTFGDLRRWVESERPNNPPITVEPHRMTYAELSEKYHELLMAVERKFPGESRHQTALRYIRRAEEPATTAAKSEVKK